MILDFNKNKNFLIFKPEDTKELENLLKFPGLLYEKATLTFYMPAKINVAYNIVQRLKRKVIIKASQEVLEFINQEFKLKEIPKSFKFHTDPLRHQEVALRYAYTVGNAGLLLAPGMGKTKVVLDFIELMGIQRGVIICPKSLRFVWIDEAAIHRPEVSVYVVETTDWEKELEGVLNNRLTIVNYNKAVTLRPHLEKVGFEFIGLDEALIKDYKTERTKEITKLSKSIPRRMLMSGTLVNNSPLDVFAPVRFLEPALVGEGITRFKEEYVVSARSNKNIIVGFKRIPEIRSILNSTSIVMTKEEWLQLPEKKFEDIYITMADDQRKAYNDLLSNYLATIDGREVEVDSPLTVLTKLTQISNGFIYINDTAEDELTLDGKAKKKKRETIFFEKQPKADKLAELLTGRLKGRKVIVWFNMEGEFQIITSKLEELGVNYLSIKGGEKAVGDKVRQFNIDPTVTVLLCQAKSVNYGITVLGTSAEKLESMDIEVPPGINPEVYTQVFYSLNFSLEVYLQQQDRTHRVGQKNVCEYIHLITNNPTDRGIKEKIEEKKTIKDEVLQDILKTMSLVEKK